MTDLTDAEVARIEQKFDAKGGQPSEVNLRSRYRDSSGDERMVVDIDGQRYDMPTSEWNPAEAEAEEE